LQEYELTVLVNPDKEPELEKVLSVVEKLITDAKGKIIAQEDWGKKALAYPIAKQTHAIYHFWHVELPGAAVAKLDSTLNITEDILRHLIVKFDANKAELAKAATIATTDDKE
jgi:small subunit ribosomal protein S6